ncbi:hypothetical protein TRFO_09425 [Tritrichomonas foetus]|uniref:TLC domain-containing protein n=1 Tax=Tritrichomonas foetus TaxID=1144522 RepID=A0A1J4JGK2_9EUKA|nr:hypothetical protein TRFO_09425 [Tritrichomonas foetus]|eukprot:OHS97431.1 hypothetical protein TRFO_09425 [Tritrichomonas foetus]
MIEVSNILSAITEGTKLNKCLTFGLFGCYFFTIKVLFTDSIALIEFIFYTLFIMLFNQKLTTTLEKIAFWLQDHVFYNKHNKNAFDKFTLGRFKGQGIQLVTHTIGVLLAVPTLFQEGWLGDFKHLFSPCPVEQTMTHAIRIAYMFELASYCYQAFEHRFRLVKNKDYYIMFAHHLTTIILIAGSYYLQCWRIGLVVLFLHDFSDIFLDVNLMFNQSGMEGPEYYYANEILFVCTALSWFLFRLVYLPNLIYHTVIDGHRMCALNHPGEPWKYPKCEGIPFYWGGVTALSALVVMHAYWFYLMIIVAIHIVRKSNKNKAGETYETQLKEKEE